MDREFIEVPKEYYCESAKQGRLVRIEYDSRTYYGDNHAIHKDALVYLPYGYDEADKDTKYNVFYYMHGGSDDANVLFGGLEAKTNLKNILDNMIANGDIKPIIVVTPTFYHETDKQAKNLTQNFHHEFVNDLIPKIESEFNVNSERTARIFGGFSMGAEATWNIFVHCLSEVADFMPMSGDCWAIETKGGEDYAEKTVDYIIDHVKQSDCLPGDFRIFACVGDDGVAYVPMNSMIREMQQRTENFNDSNLVYCVAKGGKHTYEYSYHYVYNALPHFLGRGE